MYICKNLIKFEFTAEMKRKNKYSWVKEVPFENIVFTDEMLDSLGITEGYINCFYSEYLKNLAKYKKIKNKMDAGLYYRMSKLLHCTIKMECAHSSLVTLKKFAETQLAENEPQYVWTELRPDKWATFELQKYMPNYEKRTR